MTIFRLTPALLSHAYDLLRHTAPFDKWNLPEPEDVEFVVGRTQELRGHHQPYTDGSHQIMISDGTVGTIDNLIRTMAHEMIHVHQDMTKQTTKNQHNAAFRKIAERVCRIHGWDSKMF